jgi:penicillin-binding protein 1A
MSTEAKPKKKSAVSKAVKILWITFFTGIFSVLLVIMLAFWGVFGEMPSMEELENPSASLASEIIAADGSLIGKFYLQDRSSVEYKDISKYTVHALVATEDERFYNHSGIDGIAIGRAVFNLGTDGGGSTITQQLSKNLFTNYSSFAPLRILQKLKEWIISVRLERNFTKEEILALYLNTVPFGDNVYGIRNASLTFFQKEPSDLNINESAVLIGMLKANTLYNPRKNLARSTERRNIVLDQMVKNNYINASQAQTIKTESIPLNYKKIDDNNGIAPYFKEILRDYMKNWCKENSRKDGKTFNIYRDGLKIYTTINPKMQEHAEQAVAQHLSSIQPRYHESSKIQSDKLWEGQEALLERAMKESERWKNMKEDLVHEEEIRRSFTIPVKMKVFAWNNKREKDTTMSPLDSIKYHKTVIQTGFMVMDPLTGEVRAWVGGPDFKRFKYDHVNINTKRQVGSTFKPLLYAYAIDKMEGQFTPETNLPSGPISLGGRMIRGGGGPLAYCLAYSKNPGAAYLMNQVGPKNMVAFAKEVGITSHLDPVPMIALGSEEISIFEMLHSYTMFPNNGISTEPLFVTRIEDKNGNILENFFPNQKIVMSESGAYTMCAMMKGVVRFGTGKRLNGMNIPCEKAGKTGTTNDNTDTWYIGYTPQLLAGCWVGCDDPFLKMPGQGNSMALPIWGYFFQRAMNDPSLGLTKNATFVQPESMMTESFMDYENFAMRYQNEPDAENVEVENGNNSQDYEEYNQNENESLDDSPEEIYLDKDTVPAPKLRD